MERSFDEVVLAARRLYANLDAVPHRRPGVGDWKDHVASALGDYYDQLHPFRDELLLAAPDGPGFLLVLGEWAEAALAVEGSDVVEQLRNLRTLNVPTHPELAIERDIAILRRAAPPMVAEQPNGHTVDRETLAITILGLGERDLSSIADKVGVHRTSLYRMKKFVRLAKQLEVIKTRKRCAAAVDDDE